MVELTLTTQSPPQDGFICRSDGGDSPTAVIEAAQVGGEFLRRVPRDFARQHLILSQGCDGDRERLVVGSSAHRCAIFNTAVVLGRPVEYRVGDGEAIARAIDEAYAGRTADSSGVTEADGARGDEAPVGSIDALIAEADRNLLSTNGKAPVVRLVDGLLFEALQRRASDVHVQPTAGATLVRIRLDGVLHSVRALSRELTNAVVSRIKVMGRMDIAERRVPQDGRATVTIGDRPIDLRISTLPTSYGERVVIRLLDNTRHIAELEDTGMPPEVLQRYLERATRANGMILLTGPTGSGKTTTLYSTLRRVGTAGLNIMTIEDPIEYELSGMDVGMEVGARGKAGTLAGIAGGNVGAAISQSQVNPRKGVTFATGLRHILRQDPDVVMVGEIRDAETARIAIQSSMTGHLVFSTLHTNDAVSAVTRLIDLGIEPYLVGAALSAILAQRLVRTLHAQCQGRGCTDCMATGFRGRTGLFELLVIDEQIRELVATNAPLARLREMARQGGMRTLQEDGARLVAAGRTTVDEVRRVVQGAW